MVIVKKYILLLEINIHKILQENLAKRTHFLYFDARSTRFVCECTRQKSSVSSETAACLGFIYNMAALTVKELASLLR